MEDKLESPTVNLPDEVVTVTGGNAGIGYKTANVLAESGAHLSSMARSSATATPAGFEPEIDVGSMLCGCFGQGCHNELTDGGKGMTKY